MFAGLLVLTGFCLLAAISSRASIRSLTDRVLREVSAAKQVAKEAKQQAAHAEAIAELTVEQDMEPLSKEPQEKQFAAHTVQASPQVQEILKSMVNSRFSMRSITAISNGISA